MSPPWRHKPPTQPKPQQTLGVKTHLTLSIGEKLDALFEETDRLRRLRRKLSRQTKGSANYAKTKRLIHVETEKITRRKDDCANKIVHEVLRNERVYIQDEMISTWKMRSGFGRGGRRIQHSVLGRVKNSLMGHSRVTVLPRGSATTATCVCGVRTPHDVKQRTFRCLACGYTDDRDTHAAKNMIRLGKHSEPGTHPEQTGTPVESDVRHAVGMNFSFLPTARNHSVKQEAASSSATP